MQRRRCGGRTRCATNSFTFMTSTRLWLRISRPYYWLVTLWLYLLPTGGRVDLLSQWPFLVGLAYCTLPLNLMCYLMNDLADVEVDADNPRKGGDLLGAKEDAVRLRAAIVPAALLQLPFLLAFSWLGREESNLLLEAKVLPQTVQ